MEVYLHVVVSEGERSAATSIGSLSNSVRKRDEILKRKENVGHICGRRIISSCRVVRFDGQQYNVFQRNGRFNGEATHGRRVKQATRGAVFT